MSDFVRTELINRYRRLLAGDDISKDQLILDIFNFQSKNNPVYKKFINYLGINPCEIININQIPFLPTSLYKNHKIITGEWSHEKIFESSSTTGMVPSTNYVRDLQFYLNNSIYCFEEIFGQVNDFCFYALLPSYLERNSSSLVYMVDYFIKKSGCGGFYKKNYKKLLEDIKSYKGKRQKILIGVTFALIEMAENFQENLHDVIIMETGGMKGRGKELYRDEVHGILKRGFNLSAVFSEYGMTELLSQCYSTGEGIFRLPVGMDILITDIYDPFSVLTNGKQGKINIIDIANIDTCSFIATDDLGIKYKDNKFKVLGRTDESDVRGCNLLFY